VSDPHETSSSPRPVEIDADAVYRITRPDSRLLAHYLLRSLLALPLFPILFLFYLRIYLTLRFQFTDESVTVLWGRLWRREVYLTYARIQDIHLTRDLFQRWLGLGTVHIQTASGSSKPEVSIEGLVDYDLVREFLYSRMRGASRAVVAPGGTSAGGGGMVEVLEEIRDELRSIRRTLEAKRGST
jgi:putative membrane protein